MKLDDATLKILTAERLDISLEVVEDGLLLIIEGKTHKLNAGEAYAFSCFMYTHNGFFFQAAHCDLDEQDRKYRAYIQKLIDTASEPS